jgi:hypothetical protein
LGGARKIAAAGQTLEGAFQQGADEAVLVQARHAGESTHGTHVKEAVGAVESRLRKLPGALVDWRGMVDY